GGALPAGLGLTGAGNATISGTPTGAGPNSFTVKVTDQASASQTANLSITVAPNLTITTAATLPSGNVGDTYSQTLAANGGTSPYGWSLIGGALPAGLTLSGAGVIS